MSLEEIAAELYGLPPQEFTAARNARAKEARAAGDKDLAQQVSALGKPTAVGWLANQLVREHPEELRSLLELGALLREATANLAGDELKELSRQQRRVVHALVQQARALAGAAGHPASEDTARGLEETLHAALADQDAADELAAGRLTGVLSSSGFPGAAPSLSRPSSASRSSSGSRSGAAGRAAGRAGAGGADADRADALEQARRDEEQAGRVAEEAAAERDRAQAALDEASAALDGAIARAEELKRQLAEAGEEQVAAQRRVRAARETADKADRHARRAAQRHADAQQRRERFDPPHGG